MVLKVHARRLEPGMLLVQGSSTTVIDDVRYIKDGLIHVDTNNYTSTLVLNERDEVLISTAKETP